MRIFIAGATGAIGRPLVPMLVANGHEVVGTARSSEKAETVARAGATPVEVDILDREALVRAVRGSAPEVVVHQATALAALSNFRKFDQEFEVTNRIRTAGTDNLILAAREAGARRFVAQSFAGHPFARQGGPVKTETDPLDPDPPAGLRRTVEAIRYLEGAVTGLRDMDGLVLRYGGFYGPGTSLAKDGAQLEGIRKGRFPIVGRGTGVWSFIHIDDAAEATALAIEREATGIYQIVDDEPAPVSEWLPVLAAAAGGPAPKRVPEWVARLLVGAHGVVMMTDIRGASTAKAKRDLGWAPRHPSWRTVFMTALGSETSSNVA